MFSHIEESKSVPLEMMPSGLDTESERYELRISNNGYAVIKSVYMVGAIRAIETFAQLISQNENILTSLPILIEDMPRYAYRGLMLDVAREFYPVDVLKTIIDGLRMTKINVLHLHLSDDDSFPVQFPSFPKMTVYTAFTKKEYYSEKDMKDLIDYAYKRGIKIVPEIDAPGHTRAIGQDPRLYDILTCFNQEEPWEMPDNNTIVGGPSSAVLNPAKDKTKSFLSYLARDVVKMFDKSDFYHFGGDEVNVDACWSSNPEIQQYMEEHGLKDGNELFDYFNAEIQTIINNFTDKPVVHWIWEQDFHTHWKNDSVLQFWGDSYSIPEFKSLFKNQKHILSPTDFFYLDCGYGNRYGQQLCNPIKTWAHMYTFEPTDYYAEDDETLLGGEACMWSELNTPYNVFNKVWPRLAVLAHIYWSPKLPLPLQWDKIVKDLVTFRNYIQNNGIPANKISSRYGETHPYEVFQNYQKSLYDENITNCDDIINSSVLQNYMGNEYNDISPDDYHRLKEQLIECFERFI